MAHRALMTFDFDETGEYFRVNCVCPDCLEAQKPIFASTAHLRALTLALIAACTMLDVDLSAVQAGAVELDTPEERRALELRYRGALHDFVNREPVIRPETRRDYIDHRVIEPVQRVIVHGKKPDAA